MMRATEKNMQDSIMGRRDCNDDLREFFDDRMKGMYGSEYQLKFSSQIRDTSYRKEQRMMELIRSATLAGDKEKLKMLQQFGDTGFSDGKPLLFSWL